MGALAPLLGFLCLAALLATCTVGCSPPPPSEEALLYYLENASYGGKVRRAWPAGQQYLDNIMKPCVVFWDKEEGLRELASVESLWPKSDPRWQDKAAIDEHVEELEKLLKTIEGGDQPATAESAEEPTEAERLQRLTPAELIEEIGAAINDLPADLEFPGDASRRDFIHRAWIALLRGHDAAGERVAALEAQVRTRLALYRSAASEADDFDSERGGLARRDDAREAELVAQYDAFCQTLADKRDAFVEYADERLVMLAHYIRDVDKREDRFDYELYDNESNYLRDRLNAMLKARRAQADGAASALAELEKELRRAAKDERPQLEVSIKAQGAFVEELRTVRDAVQARVKEVLKRAEEVARIQPDTGD